jgi:hypothetical protein
VYLICIAFHESLNTFIITDYLTDPVESLLGTQKCGWMIGQTFILPANDLCREALLVQPLVDCIRYDKKNAEKRWYGASATSGVPGQLFLQRAKILESFCLAMPY